MIGLEILQITPKQMVGRVMVLRAAAIKLATSISYLNMDLIEKAMSACKSKSAWRLEVLHIHTSLSTGLGWNKI